MLLRNHDSSLLPFKLHIDYVDSVTKMTCKGICVRHKAQKPVGSGRYASGHYPKPHRCHCYSLVSKERIYFLAPARAASFAILIGSGIEPCNVKQSKTIIAFFNVKPQCLIKTDLPVFRVTRSLSPRLAY